MKIKKIKVQNFKGFRDSGWIELAPSFNIIVGQNNSGKSAFLDALGLRRAVHMPFRSEAASEPHEIIDASVFDLEIEMSWADWVEAISTRGGNVWLPAVNMENQTQQSHLLDIKEALQLHTFSVRITPGGSYTSMKSPCHGFPNNYTLQVSPTKDKQDLMSVGGQVGPSDSFVELLADLEPGRIVMLAAQRAMLSASNQNTERYLQRNAENLPTVLNTMSNTSPTSYRQLIGHVAQVFPGIVNITTPMVDNNRVEVRLWSTERQDKLGRSIPLHDSGTGVAQAIAILYVAISYPDAILVIDEINSFTRSTVRKTNGQEA